MHTDDIFIRKPSQLDERIRNQRARIVPPSAWIVGVVLLAVAAAFILWAFTGTVTESAGISGVVFPQSGISEIKSRVSGQVSYLQVKVGETVEAGDLIAIIPQQELLGQARGEDGPEPAVEQQSAPTDAPGAAPESEADDERLTLYQLASMIYAPVSGRVVDLTDVGEIIAVGDLVAGIASSDEASNEAEIRAYVPATVAQRIKKGMDVKVYPSISSGEQYGYIRGLVSSISSYPITEADISGALGRFYNSDNLPDGENIIEVRVTLMADSDETTLSWSASDGESFNIDIGTLCTMEVIISEKTPWEYFIS